MSGKLLKEKAKNLSLPRGSKYEPIRALIVKNFFDLPKTTKELITEIRHTFGKKLKPNEVQTYMKRFLTEGIIRAVRPTGHRGNFWVMASVTKEEALRLTTKDKQVLKIEEELFSDQLLRKIRRYFNIELEDLRHNFGKSGTCTAFLLRKILEKLIYLTFTKNGIGSKVEDKTKVGGLVGLETMINIASSEKIRGVPFLMPKTAKEIKGIKFLGDAAAHNPLVNVDMKSIIPQMPYIITAFEELSKKL
ncbi:MAG: hypothetical protein E3J36_02105 [Candidatus Nealsonbacteria bacterium]|nr:MAG: hypothetical protein E3J36_02105 [Candidatus Nealsonbacteria bacterium]